MGTTVGRTEIIARLDAAIEAIEQLDPKTIHRIYSPEDVQQGLFARSGIAASATRSRWRGSPRSIERRTPHLRP